jgi:hypothetical protein
MRGWDRGGWLAATRTDIAALRASWQSVRGGWLAARRDAAELIRHRRVLVDTQAMTPDGMRAVLRTRLRLIGDTETDILRAWLAAAPPEAVAAATAAHFASVAAAAGGWAAAIGMERLAVRFFVLAGTLGGAAAALHRILVTEASQLVDAVLTDWHLWVSVASGLLGGAVRWLVRLRLRALLGGG